MAVDGCAQTPWTTVFANACQKDTLLYRHLCLCSIVSRGFKADVGESLRLLRTLFCHGDDGRQCTGEDVLRALARVSSQNLLILDFRNCFKISHQHMALILALVREQCPQLKRINLEGCRPTAVLCAVALRANEVFGTASPRELYFSIKEACHGERCAFAKLLGQLSEGPGAQLEIDPEFEPQAADEDAEGESSILFTVARLGSAWVMALVLSVVFGEGKVRFECHERDRHGKTTMHYATAGGDTDLCHLLKDAGADVNEADARGCTPLLSACAACDLALAQSLVSWGANVRAVRQDGAGVMALALHSQRTDMIKFAVQHDPRPDGDMVSHGGSGGSACAKAYLSPHNIARWLLAGSAPHTLVLEIGALMTLPDVDTGIKERLARVRSCLDRHLYFLEDTSAWPVAHCIEQLFMQEFGALGEHDKGAGAAGSGDEKHLIECRNKEELTRSFCFSITGQNAIRSVAISPDGRVLARADGFTVVLCCATSAIELHALCGHR
jgi:hypothetical protein